MAKKKNKKSNILAIIIVILAVVYYLYTVPDTEDTNNPVVSPTPQVTAFSDNLAIHYIDVGQADSILITQKGQTMLIDAGNNGDGDLVVDYIKAQGISTLDYVIGTHAHEDHIGGLDDVIDALNIKTILIPNVMHDTKTFRDVITAIENKNLSVTTPKVGNSYTLGDTKFTILSCRNEDSKELNLTSIVIRMEFGNQSYIFCGDAEKENEYDMIASGLTLKSNVIKLGHHGSSTSSSEEFLAAVDPEIAIISCGEDNDYGHPHKETMALLKKLGLKVYRTDLSGHIVITSDGIKNTVVTQKGE